MEARSIIRKKESRWGKGLEVADCVGFCKNFGFYFMWDAHLLEDFEKRNMIWLLFWKHHSGSSLENRLYLGERKWKKGRNDSGLNPSGCNGGGEKLSDSFARWSSCAWMKCMRERSRGWPKHFWTKPLEGWGCQQLRWERLQVQQIWRVRSRFQFWKKLSLKHLGVNWLFFQLECMILQQERKVWTRDKNLGVIGI